MNYIFRINKKDVVFQVFDEEIIIINLESGFYYSYGGPGTVIWKMLETDATFDELNTRLQSVFNGDSEEMTRILGQSLGELEREGLIVRDEGQQSAELGEADGALHFAPEGNKPLFTAPVLERHEDMQDFLLVDPIHEIDYSELPKKK